jgi:hypothetical protein
MLATLALALVASPQEPPMPAEPAAAASAPGFRYEPGRIPVGRVLRYRKSNVDGSHPSEIALYLASETRIESLKYAPGTPEATLVTAEMDWEVASVQGFTNHRVDEHGGRTLVAELATTPDRARLTAKIGPLELACELPGFPWHSYDFDLASLNVALRFLVDPKGETELQIVDPVQGAGGPALEARGPAYLVYESEEDRGGVPCLRYTLDGPGLEDRGGSLWVAAGDDAFLVGYEIDLPDEPGMDSGKLEWLGSEMLSAGEWDALVAARAAGQDV